MLHGYAAGARPKWSVYPKPAFSYWTSGFFESTLPLPGWAGKETASE